MRLVFNSRYASQEKFHFYFSTIQDSSDLG